MKRTYYNYKRVRKDNLKDWFKELKSGPCADCGNKFPFPCMDFDHRDGTTKTRNVAILVGDGYSKTRILEEIAKCDLVCANCHRIRTQNRGWNTWDKCKRIGSKNP